MTNPEDALDIAGHEPDGAGAMAVSRSESEETTTPDEGDEENVEPVELLVQLAERGEIEPWDIDIVAVTDAFLDELDERDLRTSGRALFYASVLLRMKSDALLEDDEEEPEEETVPPWEAPMAPGEEGELGPDPIAALESEMDRRLERKDARGTPETLDELVRELREAERGSWWKEGRTYDTDDSPAGFQRGTQELDYRRDDATRAAGEPTQEDVTGTAHGEDIEETIAGVRGELTTQYDAGRREVLFAEIDDAGPDRVQTFLALLFLANRGVVVLEQDDLFGDLWVRDDRYEESDGGADGTDADADGETEADDVTGGDTDDGNDGDDGDDAIVG